MPQRALDRYLIPLMNGDVIDMDEHRTGLRREGMYAGVNSLVTKPAISIAQAVFLGIIGAFGYDQALAKGAQSVSAQTGILIGWVAVPAKNAAALELCYEPNQPNSKRKIPRTANPFRHGGVDHKRSDDGVPCQPDGHCARGCK